MVREVDAVAVFGGAVAEDFVDCEAFWVGVGGVDVCDEAGSGSEVSAAVVLMSSR